MFGVRDLQITKNLKAVEKNENDKEAWSNLASSLFTANVDEARSVFQVIMKSFPTSSRFLRMFCDMESRARNYNALEHVASRKSVHCSCWKCTCRSARAWTYMCTIASSTITNCHTTKPERNCFRRVKKYSNTRIVKRRSKHCSIPPLRRLACSTTRTCCGERTSPSWTSSRATTATNPTAPSAFRNGARSSSASSFFPSGVSPYIHGNAQMSIRSGRTIPNSRLLWWSPRPCQRRRRRRRSNRY